MKAVSLAVVFGRGLVEQLSWFRSGKLSEFCILYFSWFVVELKACGWVF